MSTVDDRWQAFRDEYNGYDPVVIHDVLAWLYDDVLPSVFGENASEAALIAAYEHLGFDLSEVSAISVLDDADLGEVEKFPMYHDLLALHAYAYFGLIDRKNISRSTYRETYPDAANDIEAMSTFLKLFDTKYTPEYPNPSGKFPKFICDQLEPAFRAARARMALDTMEGGQDIDQKDLAFLAKLKLRSIRNLTMGKPAILQANENKRIPTEHARRWLLTRKKFRWSLLDVPDNGQTLLNDKPSPSRLQNVLFVPVDKNKTWFSPSHHKEGIYSVGPRGNEEKYDDYFTALEALHHMDPPMWRRKADKKRWTVVMGIEWIRKAGSELAEISDRDHSLVDTPKVISHSVPIYSPEIYPSIRNNVACIATPKISRAGDWLDLQIEARKEVENPFSIDSIRWRRIELLKRESSSLSIREFNRLCRRDGLNPGSRNYFRSAVKSGCIRIYDGSGQNLSRTAIV